ncbi:MAG: hypothetical protein M3552_09200 [Planctomycetota bacterium]|nr:hypothetical protein [Planctomycetaceae bacterium]MDQ3330815.1 hypothetical protein [Planctomycetota bacterium]
MSQSPPLSPVRTSSLARWGPAAIVFLELMICSAVQAPVPGVNEPQYLGKAAHLWNPAWAAGDMFLESSNPHLVFYLTVGWLTRFLSLEATAWVARFFGYGVLAIGWTALAGKVVGTRIAAVPSAAIFLLLASIGNLSGEWLVGGIEGKVFAYGLMFLAIVFWLEDRLIPVALCLGGVISFHPIVGGWGLICGLGAEIASRIIGLPSRNFSPKTLAVAGGLFLLMALPGALPAAFTLGGASHETAVATYLQVFWRLRHHLDPTQFSAARYAGYAGLFVAWLCLFAVTRRLIPSRPASGPEGQEDEGSVRTPLTPGPSPQRRGEVMRGFFSRRSDSDDVTSAIDGRWLFFVAATVVVAAIGVVVGWRSGSTWAMPLRDLRGTLLKFYPFRLADVFVPLAFSLAVSRPIMGDARLIARHSLRAIATTAVTISAFTASMAIPQPDRNPSRLSPEKLQAWKDVAAWARQNTPAGTVLVTPSRQWGFKWYSHRAEYVNFKDSPQDTPGLIEWKRRLDVLRNWWTSSPDGRYSKADLQRLGDETRSNYLVTYAYSGRFAAEPLYDNGVYRIYSLR